MLRIVQSTVVTLHLREMLRIVQCTQLSLYILQKCYVNMIQRFAVGIKYNLALARNFI